MIWTAIKLALKTKGLGVEHWSTVLPQALHSIRSLLCTATNTTPHERMFHFNRRSCLGSSVPSCLSSPGPVLLKRHVRANKHEPLVDEVELVHAALSYANVRFPGGRETSVSLRDIAPTNERNLYLNDQLPVHDDLEMCDSNFVDVENNSPLPQAPDTPENREMPVSVLFVSLMTLMNQPLIIVIRLNFVVLQE